MNSKTLLLAAAAAAFALQPVAATDYTLAVNYGTELGTVSGTLLGANSIYCNEPDAQWSSGTGNIPTLLTNNVTKFVRFPGGTVVTFWHWTDPNVPGHTDSWDPSYNHSSDLPASATMSIDEYLAYCSAQGATPLVGINMGSGRRWNRITDGINEAKALVQHCMDSGVNVTYYYLDNEPYASDANYTFTAAEYADSINQYAPAMKTVNPNIKIIACCHPGDNTTGHNYTQTVLNNAGANIDICDIHCYWNYNSATFTNWTNQAHMLHQGVRPYSELRAFYKGMAATAGFPNIEFAALEWNVGPEGTGNPEPTEAQSAIMAAEELMQFASSGVEYASIWPLHWESGDWHRAVISSAQSYTPNKLYDALQQFTTIPFRMQISGTEGGTADQTRLTYFVVKTNDLQTVYVYLINKNQTLTSATVDLDLTSFSNFNAQSAVGYESSDVTTGPLDVHSITVTKSGTHVSLPMLKNSFAKVTISRPPPQTTVDFAPAKDAMVKAAAATTNFGTLTQMQCSGQSGFAKDMYLQFNVTGLPAGATIVSATLKIDSQTTATGRTLTAHSVSSTSWGETTITWNNKPAFGTTRGSATNYTSGSYTSWDVTGGVTGNGNVSFGVDSTFSGDTNFSAREAGASVAPVLEIVYQ